MANFASILTQLLPCCETADRVPSATQALLDSRNIGILSAACCDTTAAPTDQRLKNNVLLAMEIVGDQRSVVVDTITAAQRNLRQLEAQADAAQKRLIAGVMQLFQSNGLSIFPILIIDGRIAYYGGVPTVEMIQQKLQSQLSSQPSTIASN